MGDNMKEEGGGDTDQTPPTPQISPKAQLIQENFKNLSGVERFFFKYASSFVAVNATACGVMSNNLFRRTLKVRKSYLLSLVPAVAVPLLLSGVYYEMLITRSLFEDCAHETPVSTLLMSSYIGGCVGGLGSFVLGAVINLPSVLNKPQAQKGTSMMQEMISFGKPMFMRMKYFILFQAGASIFITYTQMNTMKKALRMSPLPETETLPE
ncbi:transmembrane protein 126A [Pyxicephalus adspersus]|uniref:Transmembrane protein 126A n=1 Tax=Pyxicephalus adspersus TaxID=30357 RepID=A0AAV3AWR9_PYXAD|nr:TPA: hypothetical protein GDO54_000191 [Pyxicephalus adspersus]